MPRFFRATNEKQVEQSHAHRDSIGDLLEHAGLRAIRDFRGDFDATIHRAGMKNDGVGPCEAEALGAELIEKNVVRGGKSRFVKALSLNAEDENDIGIFESLFDAELAANGSSGRTDAFKFAGNPHGWAAEREAAAELSEQVNVGASHAAVGDVAENGDIQIGERAFAVADS